MRKESWTTSTAENRESGQIIESRYDHLKTILREQADSIRKMGFDVDNDLRVSPEKFKGFLGDNVIAKDQRAVQKLESEVFIPKQSDPNYDRNSRRGEALEMAKAVMLNRDLFQQRLIAVRTCKYDDYANDVDEIIIDSQTGHTMAAIDTTTDLSSKLHNPKILQKVANGCRVKYGLSFNPATGVVEKVTYNKLPLFIISISTDQLADIVSQLAAGFSDAQRSVVENYLQSSLSRQSRAAADIAAKDIKDSYNKAAAIFDSLAK